MKKILKYTAFAAMVGLFSSCSDSFFEAESGDIITSDQMDEVDPVAGLNGMYAYLYKFDTMGYGDEAQHYDYGYHHILLCSDLWGQDMIQYSSKYGWYYTDYQFNQNSRAYQYISTFYFWNYLYKLIKSANDVLKTTTDDSKKEDRGQALGMRAFAYLTLVQMYQHTYKGNESKPCVPPITNENANEAAANGCARSTVQEVYDQIMSDLNKAVSLLEATDKTRGTDKRYISKEVAYGLRARVNLTMQNWTAAAEDAQKAINGSGTPYSREEAGAPGFTESSDHSWMWAIVIAETDRVVTSGIVNFPSHMGSLNYGYASVGSWRMINKKLYNEIPDTDVRKGWWLDANKHSDNLNATQVAQATKYGCPAYTQMKYGPYKGVMAQSTNASDIPLMRVEEMYLILAEAQAMGGNPSTGAATLQKFVNDYRDPAYVCTASSATAVQDAVWQQRRIELWGEGLSYFDILRLNKGIDRRGAGFPAAYVFNVPAGDNTLIYRIPESEEQGNSLISASDNNPVTSIPSPVTDN